MENIRTIKKILKVDRDVFYKKYLYLLNVIFPVSLNLKEVEVLSSFMSLDKSIIEENIVNPLSRKMVKEKLKLSSAGLSNYISTITDKGFFSKNPLTGVLKLNKYIDINPNGFKFEIFLMYED